MATDYRDRAQTMLFVGISVIILLLLLRYKSLLKTVQTLLPAFVAALFILGGWSMTGQAVSFLHLVGFLLAVAICVDYGIFYRENRGGNICLTYQAMSASMLTSALAFGCLFFADTSTLRTLAGVVALGVMLGFLLCPIIINHSSVENT
jgi:predicted exporter